MSAPEKKMPRYKSISLLLAFALSFLAVFNISSASTLPCEMDFAQQAPPISKDLASKSYNEHTPTKSGKICGDLGCKAFTDCAVSCTMNMGCASVSVLLGTAISCAQTKSPNHINLPYTSTGYASRQSNPLFRPPIC